MFNYTIYIYLYIVFCFMVQRARRVKRCIDCSPKFICFKPDWVAREILEKDPIEFLIEEYEAIRLSDVEWFSMQEWAKKMWVSASTFNRMVKSAHKKLAKFVVFWKWLRVYER